MMIRAGSIEELSLEKACISIGSFDGVHLGHQKLISKLIESAEAIDAASVVLTFFPHPAVVLRNISTPYYLSTPEEKSEQLERLGVNYQITLPFTSQIAALTASDFMQLLVNHLGVNKLVVGQGFALGKKRLGTVEVLSSIGNGMGFSVETLIPEIFGEDIISSSKIRTLIEKGDVQSAAILLGSFYEVHGTVEKGDARGRSIGFPTANLDIWPQKLLPAAGVYRCFTILNGQQILSVANIGYRPTFTDDTKRVYVEVHLLDFDADLYGKELEVQFTHRLRGEIKFPSFEELIRQIQCDILTARNI